MFETLNEIKRKFYSLKQQLENPEYASDSNKIRDLMKEIKRIEKIVSVYEFYEKIQKDIKSAKEILELEQDESLRNLAKEEIQEGQKVLNKISEELKLLLLPKDPHNEKNIILEMRAGAGGDEASLFVQELFKAYSLFAGKRRWIVKILNSSEGNAGGMKEIISNISGDLVYSFMKYESGVHRVQRVPKTESQGRVHTSTITVAVLPEVEEAEIEVNPSDVRVDVYRSSGHGGQSVNTTDSAVRLTHLPTGLIVTCQDGKSQHSNKQQAFKVLYARLKVLEEEKNQKEASKARLAQIGTGDRSERIRTYNFPQTRITDHRINFTSHRLKEVMEGELNYLTEPLNTYFQAEKLKVNSKVL